MKILTPITHKEFDTDAHTYSEAQNFQREFWADLKMKKWKLKLLYWLKKLSIKE